MLVILYKSHLMSLYSSISYKLFFLLLLASLSVSYTYGQNKVKWLTWEEAQNKSETIKKKVFVDVYTEWCGWCKKMDKATFQQDDIAAYLNEYYYAVKFDAESKKDIVMNGKVYKYVKSGKRGYHQLALEIMKGKLSYPTIVFLDENLDVLQPIPGYRGPKEFKMMMAYFAGDYFKSVPWKQYSMNYNPDAAVNNSRVVKN